MDPAAAAAMAASPARILQSRRMSEVGSNHSSSNNTVSPRKRRCKSMAGGSSELELGLAKSGSQNNENLSPRKKARRSLLPGKSILKASHSGNSLSTGFANDDHAYTTTTYTYSQQTQTQTQTVTESIDSHENTPNSDDAVPSPAETTENMTMSRRLSRRVSFAATAQLREFARDGDHEESTAQSPPQADPSSALHLHLPPSSLSSQSPSTSTSSPSKQRRRSSTRSAGTGHRRRSSVANAESLAESFSQPAIFIKQNSANANANDESALMDMDTSGMELADTSNITSAFKSAFSFPRTSIGAASVHHQQEEEDTQQQQSFMSTGSMDLADEGDVTSAFALNTHLFGSSINAPRRRSSVAFASAFNQPVRSATDTLGQSPEALQVQEGQQKEYAVPLGQEGIDEEAVTKAREERIRRGSIAFYSTKQSNKPTIALPDGQEAQSTSSTINGLFAVHHSPELGDGAFEGADNAEAEEEGEMDMSVVQDTRRISNVFAVAFSAGASINEEEEEEAEVDKQSASGNGRVKGLYPSLDALKAGREENTPGAAALAFLDDEEEDEEVLEVETPAEGQAGQQKEEDDVDLLTPPPASQSQPVQAVTPPKTFESLEPPSASTTPAQHSDYFPPASVISEVVYQPRNARLSVVPERFEEEEEEGDTTQDLGQASSQQSSQQSQQSSQPQQPITRRLSIAHPSAIVASPARSKSPRRSSAAATLSIKAGRSPSPRKPSTVPAPRRQSLAAVLSTSPTRSSSFTDQQSTQNDLYKSAPASSAFSGLSSTTPSRLPIPTSSSKLAISPAKLASQTLQAQSPNKHVESGLTPAMSRLSSWTASQQANPASSSAAASSAARRLSFKTPSYSSTTQQQAQDGLAPTSEPIFDEAAPLDTESRKLSLDEFLSLTGVQFMDDMGPSTAMTRRKSMMSASTRFNSENMEEEEKGPRGFETTLADQAIASAAILPVMDMYRMMGRELRSSLSENAQLLDELDEAVNDETPQLFKDFMDASEEERAMLETQFKLTKTFYRLQTRNEWYDYRSTVVDSLTELLSTHIANLEADRSIIRSTQSQLVERLPSLRSKASDLRAELEKEKKRQQEFESADQEHLSELRRDIEEQNVQVEDYKRENLDAESRLERLNVKHVELDEQMREAKESIEKSKKVVDEVRYYTKSEAYRLKDELDLLEYLHSWSLIRFDSHQIELLHKSDVSITLLLKQGGFVQDYELFLVDEMLNGMDEVKRSITTFLFERLKTLVVNSEGVHVRDLLRHITHLWTCARRVRAELMLVSTRYPLSVSLFTKKSRSGAFLRACARVYCSSARAEFNVVFELTGEEIVGDLEHVAAGVGCSIDVKYGPVDREELVYIVRDRVSQGGSRAFLEACQDAEQKYT